MAKVHTEITPALQEFIAEQHIFFVSSAPLSGDDLINLSPKGLDCFRVLSPQRVAYMDLIGSGNETSAHLLENGRITFMFCAFAGPPNILRLYGKGHTVLPGQPEWEVLSQHFTLYPSTRHLIVADITRVQTSCGFGVPKYEYQEERDQHFKWMESKGKEGLAAYQEANNMRSIDGLPTALLQQKTTASSGE
jgi:hypothetical protein